MISSPKTLFLVVFNMLVFASSGAFACMCDQAKPPIADAFIEADAVFVGTVERVNSSDTRDMVNFKVTGSWKGLEYNSIQLRQSNDAWTCDSNFYEGGQFIVFAMQVKNDVPVANHRFTRHPS